MTTDNRRVVGANGEQIVIPPSKLDAAGNETLLDVIKISNDGKIQLTYGDGEMVDAGTLALAHFANSGGLKPVGGSYFKATEKSGPAIIGGSRPSRISVKSSRDILKCPTPMSPTS